MNRREAEQLGHRMVPTILAGDMEQAYALLAPVLAERTPFQVLGRVGEVIEVESKKTTDPFLNRIATGHTMGGWVVIGTALGQRLAEHMEGALARCRDYIITADVWYGADSLAERVPGPALLADFDRALALLSSWRKDDNPWVRRAVGVGVHFWAKRSRGATAQRARAKKLLGFLEPLFEEKHKDAVKGIGWGLKTLGRYFPEQVTPWLTIQIHEKSRTCRAVMLRKALTYLPDELKAGYQR